MQIKKIEETYILTTDDGINIYFDEYKIESFVDNETEKDIILKLQKRTVGTIFSNNETKKEFLENMEKIKKDEIKQDMYHQIEDISKNKEISYEEIKKDGIRVEKENIPRYLKIFYRETRITVWIDWDEGTEENYYYQKDKSEDYILEDLEEYYEIKRIKT